MLGAIAAIVLTFGIIGGTNAIVNTNANNTNTNQTETSQFLK
jgi:hypothetical protein